MALPIPDFVYGKGRLGFGTKLINWLTDPICAMVVSAVYTPQPGTDQFVTDIPGTAILIRDKALTSLGISSNGVCSGTVPALNAFNSSGVVATGLVLYVNTGTDSTARLIYYTSSGAGWPFTPAGFNYVVAFDQANGGWFQV